MQAERPAPDFKSALLAEIPQLRFFARALSGDRDRADDLVQETLIKAWAAQDRFMPGRSLRAWLFTIMRDTFYADDGKTRRELQAPEGEEAARPFPNPGQNAHLDLSDLGAALAKLPEDQRVALVLVGASGLSYEESAQICGCALGTIKSRVNRARRKLMAQLALDSAAECADEVLAAGGSSAAGAAA